MTRPASDPNDPLPSRILELGSGPGLAVMLHAAGSGPRAIERLARLLLPAVGKVMAPAFERDGVSLIGGGGEPFAAPVAIARRLLEREGEGARVLFGHSMGGLIALETLLDGAHVDVVVLYEPITLALLDPADAGDRAALAWDAEVVSRLRGHVAAGETEKGIAAFIEAYGALAWEALPAGARADLVARAPVIIAEAQATNAAALDREAIGRIGVPLLVLDGGRSPDVTRRMARRLSELVPASEHVTIGGAGHMGPVTSAAAVAPVIADFLSRRARRA